MFFQDTVFPIQRNLEIISLRDDILSSADNGACEYETLQKVGLITTALPIEVTFEDICPQKMLPDNSRIVYFARNMGAPKNYQHAICCRELIQTKAVLALKGFIYSELLAIHTENFQKFKTYLTLSGNLDLRFEFLGKLLKFNNSQESDEDWQTEFTDDEEPDDEIVQHKLARA